MKRLALLTVLLGMMFKGLSQPVVSTPIFPSSVDLFDLFEVSFTLQDTYVNPYDPDTILVYGLFTAPDNTTIKVNAFYYEDYHLQKITTDNNYYEKVTDSLNNVGWRIRFTPTSVGNWKFRIFAEDVNGSTTMPNDGMRAFQFVCNSVSNANGFITKANNRYLKRDIVKNGNRRFTSYFPVGPNVAWYDCLDYGHFKLPKGIYHYQQYIDSLDGNANYMRIWLNRYQYLSLYGPEFTQLEGDTAKVYFDSIVNQKDSAELDSIVTYAKQHGVAVTPCLFTSGGFKHKNEQEKDDPTVWENNPYNTVLHLENACDFFTDPDAKRIAKNLIRYIISRWGYATNIVSWELWNEVSKMFYMCDGYKHIEDDVWEWHNEMASFIADLDPYHRCVTTSAGNEALYPYLDSVVFSNLGIAQKHNYQNIQKAKSKEQFSYILLNKSLEAHTQNPSLPFFMGEFGFGNNAPLANVSVKDPKGIDLHNSLWSSLFSTSMGPASLWSWNYLYKKGLFKRFAPLLRFCENLPLLSDTFTPDQTGVEEVEQLVFTNNIETYYMINGTEDTIYGWCQDTAFAYQSLRWLTDSVSSTLHFVDGAVFDTAGYVYTLSLSKRPQPSFNSNTISIRILNQPVGTTYKIQWYNSETGLIYSNADQLLHVSQDASGTKYLTFDFPSFIRNLQQQVINNTFGDAVFFIKKHELLKAPSY